MTKVFKKIDISYQSKDGKYYLVPFTYEYEQILLRFSDLYDSRQKEQFSSIRFDSWLTGIHLHWNLAKRQIEHFQLSILEKKGTAYYVVELPPNIQLIDIFI